MTLQDDFARFAALQIHSGDVDPAYPVLTSLLYDEPVEQQAWKILVYVAHYNLASAMTAWRVHPEITSDYTMGHLPCATERRGLRGGKVRDHLQTVTAVAESHGGLIPWLTYGFGSDRRDNWRALQENLQRPWGNGRWAAYKTGEILMEVCDFPVTPTDAGHGWSSGPRQGLALLYPTVKGQTRAAIAALDEQTDLLTWHLDRLQITNRVEQVETALCDFHAMVEGRYYVGHDIDQQWEQAQIANASGLLADDDLVRIDLARQTSFRPQNRERSAVDRPRRLAYRKRGTVLAPWEPTP